MTSYEPPAPEPRSEYSSLTEHESAAVPDPAGATPFVSPETETAPSEWLIGPLAQLSGQTVGHYRVLDRLGAGAMSSVYRATDEFLDRAVALKVLLPGADRVTRSRFRQEARMAIGLAHPHIVHTLQVGQTAADGIAYIAMELVDGESLGGLLERFRQLSVLDACHVLEPIARALAYAHRAGVVHRDVKPSNILLRKVEPGTPESVQLSVLDTPVVPLLSDFGIAYALDSPELTSAGRTIGTPAYMSPEQCSGTHDIDGRADLYSLGAVLYRCLVGRPPFVGTTTQILYAHVYSPLTIPDDVFVRLPLPVTDILRRSLAKAPGERYADGDRLADDLLLATGRRPARAAQAEVSRTEVTATMASLPAARERPPQASTVIVPASIPPPAKSVAPKPSPRTAAASGRAANPPPRSSGERRLPRWPWAAPLLVLALLLPFALFFALRSLTVPGPAATPPAPIGESPPLTRPPTATPALAEDQPAIAVDTPAPTVSPAIQTPTTPVELPVPSINIASSWQDARFFQAERDLASALEQLTLILRTDPEFNRRLLANADDEAQLVRTLLLDRPDHPFWRAGQSLFRPSEIADMFVDIYIGLAAAETAADRPGAVEYLEDAMTIRPDSEDVQGLLAAARALSAASVEEQPAARLALGRALAAYSERLGAAERVCQAAEQLTAAQAVAPNNTAAADLAALRRRCTQAVERLTAQVDLDQLGGSFIYAAQSDGRFRLFSLPAGKASPATPLVNDATQAALSPNGRRLAFYSTRPDYQGLSSFDLAAGLGPDARDGRLTRFVEDSRDSPPSWNAAGTRLTFASTREGDKRSRIYVTWADGKDDSASLAYGRNPAWNPTGEEIVYSGVDQSGNRPGLWLMRSDGDAPRPLTTNGSDIRPAWSPDGRYVLFMSRDRDDNWEIYRLDMQDLELLRLTDDPAQDGLPTVSPDGGHVAFLSDREGEWGIWVIDINGGEAVKLAQPTGSLPNWLEHSIQWVE